jgi:hypothetical protein
LNTVLEAADNCAGYGTEHGMADLKGTAVFY